MEIIKRGRPPEEALFKGTCHNCRTIFSCTRTEGKYEHGDQREGPFLRVTCPVCLVWATAYETSPTR